MNSLERLEVDLAVGGLEVERLPANQPRRSDGVRIIAVIRVPAAAWLEASDP